MESAYVWPRASLTHTSGCCSNHTPVPSTVSLQPAAVLSPSLSSESLSSNTKLLPTPADAPPLEEPGAGTASLRRSFSSVLARHKELLCSPSDPVILLFCPAWSSHQWGGFPGCKLFFFFSSSQGHRFPPNLTFIFFPIVPPSYIETVLSSGMWGLLLIFCTCSVRIFEDISLMYL